MMNVSRYGMDTYIMNTHVMNIRRYVMDAHIMSTYVQHGAE